MELSIQVMCMFVGLAAFSVGAMGGYLTNSFAMREQVIRLETQLEQSQQSETNLIDSLHNKDRQNLE